MTNEKKPGIGGEHYLPYEERTGAESVVYFTSDLSAEGLERIYQKINKDITGKVAIKLHTGEQHGPNIIPRPWVQNLIEKDLPQAHIIETNTYYDGDRYTTEKHRETLKVNGWTFAPVDIPTNTVRQCYRSRMASGSPRCQWGKVSWTMTPY